MLYWFIKINLAFNAFLFPKQWNNDFEETTTTIESLPQWRNEWDLFSQFEPLHTAYCCCCCCCRLMKSIFLSIIPSMAERLAVDGMMKTIRANKLLDCSVNCWQDFNRPDAFVTVYRGSWLADSAAPNTFEQRWLNVSAGVLFSHFFTLQCRLYFHSF